MDSDLTTRKDEEVLRLSIQSPSLFSVLVDRYEKPFLRRALHVLRNREDAEDAVQETFTKIYLNAGRFQNVEGANFGSWGYKILLNTCFTLHQKRKRAAGKRIDVDEEVFENLAGPDDSIETDELRDVVAVLLSRLPQHMSRVLRLHFILGYRQQEIADMEGETLGAVKTRVFRAKKELAKIAKEQNIEESL